MVASISDQDFSDSNKYDRTMMQSDTKLHDQNVLEDHWNLQQQAMFSAKIFEVGEVVGQSEQQLSIEQNGQKLNASVAYSCAIEPLLSDKVLFYRAPDQAVYIVAILERKEPKPAVMKFPHGIHIHTPMLQQHVYDWKVQAINTDIFSKNTEIRLDKGQIFARSLSVFSSKIYTIAEMLQHKLGLYFRHTRKQDKVEAQHIIRSAQEEYRIDGGYGSISIKHHFTIDGKTVMFN